MLPASGGSNRDGLRAALLSSLQDVLMEVALDGRSPAAAPQAPSASSLVGSLPVAATAVPPSASQTATLASLTQPSASQFAQSLGLAGPQASTLALSGALGLHQASDPSALLGSAAAASIPRDDYLDQARAAIIRQRMISLEKKRQLALEESKRRLLEDSYAALLRGDAVGNPSANFPKLANQANFHSLPGPSSPMSLSFLASQITPQSAQVSTQTPPPQPVAAHPKKDVTALEALGSCLRKKDDPYIDVSSIKDPDPKENSSLRRTRGGVSEPFPERLHRMLEDVEKQGQTDIVSFFPHGRAFGVHDQERFVTEIMPKYFRQSKWNSFARQLNLYGFVRITSGVDCGGYYHELFLKGRPNLCLHMRRVGVPLQGSDRRKIKHKNQHNGGSDPDFYSMKAVSVPSDEKS